MKYDTTKEMLIPALVLVFIVGAVVWLLNSVINLATVEAQPRPTHFCSTEPIKAEWVRSDDTGKDNAWFMNGPKGVFMYQGNLLKNWRGDRNGFMPALTYAEGMCYKNGTLYPINW